EAALSRMVDEGGVVEDVDVAGAQGPHAEVVLLAVALAEAGLVEGADRVEHLALHVETDAHPGGDAGILAPGALLDHAAEAVRVEPGGKRVGGEGPGQRAERGVVRERGGGGHGGRRV